MRRFIVWLGAGLVAAFLLVPTVGRAAEEDIGVDKVPKPVMETVKTRFKGADITGAAKEEEGKVVYEVTIKHKGQKIDVTLTPEGELLMIEKTITAKELPKAVGNTLAEKYGKATYKIVEEIVEVKKKEEKLAYYEVLLVKADKSALEVQVTAEGKVVNEEKKRSGEDE